MLNLKITWLVLGLTLLCVAPFKIFFDLTNNDFVESIPFVVIVVAALLLCVFAAFFSNISVRHVTIRKNFMLGILGLLISASFVWNMVVNFKDQTEREVPWLTIAQAFLALLCCITFIILATSYFMGKNIANNASFFLYCPVIWLCFEMFSFLSIYNNHASVYDALMKVFLILFFLYHTQVFSTSTKANVSKCTFMFGAPTVAVSLMVVVPVLVSLYKGAQIDEMTLSVSWVYLSVAAYAIFFMFETWKQQKANAQKAYV